MHSIQNYNVPCLTSSLRSWLSYIEKLHFKSIEMDLERITQVAIRLDILRPAPFIFTITGTNGKGTTCRILEMILISNNYKVGVYSSPHLIRYTERVRVQNAELPESDHISSFAAIEAVRNNISLTSFEFSTLSALWLFKKAQLDVVILEVGLGGRLDATNIVDADIAVITNISLDHVNLLGSTNESIGREKAGIFRTGKPAVIGELSIPRTITQIAKKKHVQLVCYGIDWYFTTYKDRWDFEDAYGIIPNLPLTYTPQINVATALAALRSSTLKINKQSIYKGIANSVLPGRFQIISQSPRLILDVAHNPHAATYLAKQLKSLPNIQRVLAVIGMLRDKNIADTIANMKDIIDFWYCASLEEERGADSEQLMKYLNTSNSKGYKHVLHAWYDALISARPEDTILVYGSFYTVAHVMKFIEDKKMNDRYILQRFNKKLY